MSKPEVDFLGAFLGGETPVEMVVGEDPAPTPTKEKEPEVDSSLKDDVTDVDVEPAKGTGFVYTEGPEDETEDEGIETPSSEEIEDKASESFALAFAKFQQDEGVISEFDPDELDKIEKNGGEVEALRYLLNKQSEYLKGEILEMYAEDRKEYEEYSRLKDLGIDAETAQELAYAKKQWENATEDDLEMDDAFRRTVLTEHFKATTRFKPERIERTVDAIFHAGNDYEESVSALKELQQISKDKRIQAEKNVKEQERIYKESIKAARDDFKKSVMDRDEYIKGMKVNKITKDKIIQMVLEPAAKDARGNPINGIWAERAKDPGKFDAFIAYHIINGSLYGDLDNVKKRIKTEVTSNFEESLRNRGGGISGGKVPRTPKYDTSLMDKLIGK